MSALRRALNGLEEPVRLWWRDDDAGRGCRELEGLIGLAARRSAPVAMAAVPAWLDAAGADLLRRSSFVTVLQHGIEHRDHSRPGERKIELGGSGGAGSLGRGLRAGRERLAAVFGSRFLPVLVPPWNRIDAGVVGGLGGLGFVGLSAMGGESCPAPLMRHDVHLDLIRWREGRRQLAADEVESSLAALIGSRKGHVIGILSHHLAMDAGGLATLDRFLGVLQDHPRARLVTAGELFKER